jgi:hypothetical protein
MAHDPNTPLRCPPPKRDTQIDPICASAPQAGIVVEDDIIFIALVATVPVMGSLQVRPPVLP